VWESFVDVGFTTSEKVWREKKRYADYTRNSSGDEIDKRDLMTPFLLNLSEGMIPLDDLRDFWWVSCRMAMLQYGTKISPKS